MSSKHLVTKYQEVVESLLRAAHGRPVERANLRRAIARQLYKGDDGDVREDIFDKAVSKSSNVVVVRNSSSSSSSSLKSIGQSIGSATHKGDRRYQEDRFATLLVDDLFLAGLFDGHSGGVISTALADSPPNGLLSFLVRHRARVLPPDVIDQPLVHKLFEQYDNLLFSMFSKQAHNRDDTWHGSTATVLARSGPNIVLYNVGDSRTVLYDRHGRVLLSTIDHKPEMLREFRKVHERGGKVEFDSDGRGCFRVNGSLAMTHAFGDFNYKKVLNKDGKDSAVLPTPDLFEFRLNVNDTGPVYALLASDGLWDSVDTNGEMGILLVRAIEQTRKTRKKEEDLNAAARQLVREAVKRVRGPKQDCGSDNVTALIVRFDSL